MSQNQFIIISITFVEFVEVSNVVNVASSLLALVLHSVSLTCSHHRSY
jgi:hypothetical protein